MQVLFIAIYYPDKTAKIDRLIHAWSLKMAVEMSSVVKQLLCVIKLFRVTAGCVHSFRIRRYDPKNPPPLWIIWINNTFFDFSKETHPW